MTATAPITKDANRKRSLVISVVGAFTLLLLAGTVFAVAVQSRAVSGQAEQAVVIVESWRGVSIARAELSIASRVSAASPEQTEIISVSLDSAAEALDAVEATFDQRIPEPIQESFELYRSASDAQSALLSSGSVSDEDAVAAELRTGETFAQFSELMREEQAASLEQLRSDNDLMNFITMISTFIVAFVVPSAGLYVFSALRRTPRRARKIEQEFETISETSKAVATATAKEAAAMGAVLDAPDQPKHADQLRRSALRLEHLASLNGAVRSIHNVDVDVVARCTSIANSPEIIDLDETPIIIESEDVSNLLIWTDDDQFSLAVFELVHNAVTHGTGPVRLAISSDADMVSISVIDHGPGLPGVVEDGVIYDTEFALRGNLMSSAYGFGLLAAREAVESLGGELTYLRDNDETTLTIDLPFAQGTPLENAAPTSVTA